MIARRVLDNEIAGWALPMGSISKMIRAAASHTPDHVTRVGLGTFVDPRHRGGTLNDLAREEEDPLVQLTEIRGNEYLRYKTISVRFALLRATTADLHGNLTMERESLIGDNHLMAKAARAAGGIVIAQVNRIAETNSLHPREVQIPGPLVDYIVEVSNEPMSFFTRYDPARSGEIRVPVRSAIYCEEENAGTKTEKSDRAIIARRAALELSPNDIVNLGIGMPEGVAKVAMEEGVLQNITLTTEAGVVGGQACSGHEFGPGVNYDALVEMNAQFDFYNGGGLNCCFLGMGQVGANGNVNVSRLSKDKLTGPGGFMDIVQSTRKVVFMGSFFKKGQAVKTFQKDCGFEVTFDGPRALRAGQEVLYVTERAVFQLNYRGLKLLEIAPGLDLRKDVLDHLDFVPHGIDSVKVMDSAIFQLEKSVGLADHFFAIDTIIPKRVYYKEKENLFFVNLSQMTMMSLSVVEDFTEAIFSRCDELLRASGKTNADGATIMLKLDKMRMPLHLQPKAEAYFAARFAKAYRNPKIMLWNARDKLNELITAKDGEISKDSEALKYLWIDWTAGRSLLSRTGLRAHLESEMSMRVQPERLQMLMGGKEVITYDDFPNVIQRIHSKIYW